MEKALVAVSPGIGFGPLGEGFVRFALIENDHRTRQATRSYQAVSGAQARAGWEVNVVQAFLPVHSCPNRCCANGNATLDQSKGN